MTYTAVYLVGHGLRQAAQQEDIMCSKKTSWQNAQSDQKIKSEIDKESL